MSNKKLILKLFICSTIFITFVFALHDKRVVAASSVNELENWSKWMQPIPDNIPLARISMPGTHDSGTFKLQNPIKQVWGMTQEYDFRYQMDHGARIFDIRGRLTDDNTIVLHHGPLYLYVTLHEFINEAKQFLKDNPSETIIMSLKKEYEDMKGAEGSFSSTFEKNYFVDPIFLKTEGNIKLGDARGKIVLLKRYSGSNESGGYNNFYWPDNETFTTTVNQNVNVTVQDKYKVNYDEKVKSIKDTMDETMNNSEDLNHLYINFTSLSSGGTAWNSPYYYASYINPEIANDIKQKNPTRVGWVIQDYINEKWSPLLYQEVIRANKSLIKE